MPAPLLRLYDGFSHTSPDLRRPVRALQTVLQRYDPAVQAEMEVLKRLTSPALNLLRDADLTPPQRIAVDLLLAGRAAEALTKATAAE